jgi:hypothetical protein
MGDYADISDNKMYHAIYFYSGIFFSIKKGGGSRGGIKMCVME